MTCERLEAARKRLAATGNCRVYTILDCSPHMLLVLVVPRGCEHLPVTNPQGASFTMPRGDTTASWGRMTAPTLATIDAENLPTEPPLTKLRAVPSKLLGN